MTTATAKPELQIAEQPAVGKPQHKISELTTYELRDYRYELEKAISFVDGQHPVSPARAALQARLDAVIAETYHHERRWAHARTRHRQSP
jgi:hypothetical protein